MRRRGVMLVGAAVLLLSLSAAARAGWYQDNFKTYAGLYGGGAYIPDTRLEVDGEQLPEASFNTGVLVGGRIGWWAKRLPWLAWELNVWSDFTGFSAGPDGLTFLDFSGSALLQYLHDPLRAYVGAGALGTWAQISNGDSVSSLAAGALGQAGMEYTLYQPVEWGVFAEYRFTWNPFTFDRDGGSLGISPYRHEFLTGVDFRF